VTTWSTYALAGQARSTGSVTPSWVTNRHIGVIP
jgi:hypothetical protein